eukprot:364813-Chlamydomonas_euryale.AAC.2
MKALTHSVVWGCPPVCERDVERSLAIHFEVAISKADSDADIWCLLQLTASSQRISGMKTVHTYPHQARKGELKLVNPDMPWRVSCYNAHPGRAGRRAPGITAPHSTMQQYLSERRHQIRNKIKNDILRCSVQFHPLIDHLSRVDRCSWRHRHHRCSALDTNVDSCSAYSCGCVRKCWQWPDPLNMWLLTSTPRDSCAHETRHMQGR